MRALFFCLFLSGLAGADELDRLYARIAADLRDGKPLTVHVDVALCDNSIIQCGGRGLGDGDDPRRNLYWATSGGLRGWFERPGSGWTRFALTRNADPRVAEQVSYLRTVEPGPFWRARGVDRAFRVIVNATGWRGRYIEWALRSFAAETTGEGAHIAAYVGHNGWMDTPSFEWPKPTPHPAGVIAIACLTKPWLHVQLPLVLTRDLLFAGSHSLDGAIQAVARGESLPEIRDAAARAYADGEGKPFQRVRKAFTN